MKIIVTGATGFIGTHCVDLLLKGGYEVHAISRSSQRKRLADKLFWYEEDLFDLEKIEYLFNKIKPKYFMHLAWKMQTGLNLNYNDNDKWLELSKKLISIFNNCGGKRILVSGSCFEYDLNQPFITEKTVLRPYNKYGISKMKLFNFLNSFSNNNDLSYIWARIFFTYGPGQKKESLVPYVINSMIEDKLVETTDGYQIYDYLYVEDIASALVLLLESSYIGAVNVSSGKGIKLKDFILKIVDYFKKEGLVKFGAKPRPEGSPEQIQGSNELLKDVTGWKEEFNLDKGVEKFIKYYTNKN